MKEMQKHNAQEIEESRKFIHRIKIKLGLENEPVSAKVIRYEIGVNILKFVIGAIAIVLGADLLTTNGSELARIIGISERVIGVTIIAIGTSLPELVTTITALIKKEASLSVGNIIGANIINLTLILPICALIVKGNLFVSDQLLQIDFPACLLLIGISILPTLITRKFARWQGVIMLGTYIGYIIITTMAVI
jgi:cation:H+ antiporter